MVSGLTAGTEEAERRTSTPALEQLPPRERDFGPDNRAPLCLAKRNFPAHLIGPGHHSLLIWNRPLQRGFTNGRCTCPPRTIHPRPAQPRPPSLRPTVATGQRLWLPQFGTLAWCEYLSPHNRASGYCRLIARPTARNKKRPAPYQRERDCGLTLPGTAVGRLSRCVPKKRLSLDIVSHTLLLILLPNGPYHLGSFTRQTGCIYPTTSPQTKKGDASRTSARMLQQI